MPWSMSTYTRAIIREKRKKKHEMKWKMEKPTLGFGIYKIWQILMRFARSFHQALTSYFWRVYMRLDILFIFFVKICTLSLWHIQSIGIWYGSGVCGHSPHNLIETYHHILMTILYCLQGPLCVKMTNFVRIVGPNRLLHWRQISVQT